jgi:transposase
MKKRHGNVSHRVKLTNKEVLQIWKTYAKGGISLRTLGAKYGVSENLIWRLVHRKTCKELTQHLPDIKLKRELSAIPRGHAVKSSKLTEEKVFEIRKRLAQGVTCVALASEFGVSFQAISLIKQRSTWAHI